MTFTPEQVQAAVAKAVAEALAKAPASKLSCKVSQKGCCSVYGLQRMPISLYAGQWVRLIEYLPTVQEFLRTNDALLAHKPPK